MVSARILADSINPSGSRLTSFLLTYNRFIHSEFLTHRVFSRNAASSRARPLAKVIDGVMFNTAFPEYWGAEKKGMQSGESLSAHDIEHEHERGDGFKELRGVKPQWAQIAYLACLKAKELHQDYSLHKSLCNRLLEPFDHITVVATAEAKGLSNFFALRANPAAQPEFQVLAYRMLDAYLKSEPQQIEWGNWHIPRFGHPEGPDYGVAGENGIKIATARCARLSYLTHEGKHDPQADIELHDRLRDSGHFSPFEHCAQASNPRAMGYQFSNFDSGNDKTGWLQYRKMLDNENQTNVDLAALMSQKPSWIQVSIP